MFFYEQARKQNSKVCVSVSVGKKNENKFCRLKKVSYLCNRKQWGNIPMKQIK